MNPGFWSNLSDYYRPEIKPFDKKKVFPKDYRYVFKRIVVQEYLKYAPSPGPECKFCNLLSYEFMM